MDELIKVLEQLEFDLSMCETEEELVAFFQNISAACKQQGGDA